MTSPLISVLIVTWNCRDLIGPCLDYVFESRIGHSVEVILVDNASHDGTADLVRTRYAGVRVIESSENLGFGRGNNMAATQASGDYLLLLNPDAYLTDPNALATLAAALDEDRDGVIAAVAPALVNPDGSHQLGDGGHAPTIGNIVRHQWLISRFVPGMPGFYFNRPALFKRERVAAQWLAATCLLMRRKAFDAVGGFDPAFFMYGEDVDLGMRIAATGLQQWLLPQTKVLHLQGATQRDDPEAVHVSTSFIDAIFALHRGRGMRSALRRRTLAAAMASGYLLRALAYRTKGPRSRRKADAMFAYTRHSWKSGAADAK